MQIISEEKKLNALAQVIAQMANERDEAREDYNRAVDYNVQLQKEIEEQREKYEQLKIKDKETFTAFYSKSQELTQAQKEVSKANKALEKIRADFSKTQEHLKATREKCKAQQIRIEALERTLARERGADV